MAITLDRGQAMRRPAKTSYPKLYAMSVYSYPDRPRHPERSPHAQPLDYVSPEARVSDIWDALDNPLIAGAATFLFALLFVLAWVGG